MKFSFSLAFLLFGMPMLFILREYIPISKQVFTYTIVGIILLNLINYKNLLELKIYLNIHIIMKFIMGLILILFFINSFYNYGLNEQTIYLLIIIFILISISTIEGWQFSSFFNSVLIISSFTVYLTIVTTPLDPSYWVLHGGRLYVGDTENPGLVSVLSAINFLTVVTYLIQPNKTKLHILVLAPLLLIDPILYTLSQGKSTIIGIIMILVYLLVIYFYKIVTNTKLFISILFLFGTLSTIIYRMNKEFIIELFERIVASAFALFGNETTVSAMSAEARNENFTKTWEYLTIDNIFGHGINTFRMDSPILQTAVDFGYPLAILFFILVVLYPFYLILRLDYKSTDINTKLAVLLYLFYFQNFLFHGTPYEYSIWLPFLIFLKLVSSKDYRC